MSEGETWVVESTKNIYACMMFEVLGKALRLLFYCLLQIYKKASKRHCSIIRVSDCSLNILLQDIGQIVRGEMVTPSSPTMLQDDI